MSSPPIDPTDPNDPTAAAADPNDPADPNDAGLVDALAQTAFVVTSTLTRIAAQHDVSLTQMRLFGILRDRRPRMTALADVLGLEKSTMSGLVARAEQRGLVERHKDPADARATVVALTSAGRRLAEHVHAQVRRELAPLIRHLDAADRTAIAGALTTMLAPTSLPTTETPPERAHLTFPGRGATTG